MNFLNPYQKEQNSAYNGEEIVLIGDMSYCFNNDILMEYVDITYMEKAL